MVNWVRRSDEGPAGVVDEPAPLAPAHPDADGTEWLAHPHRNVESPSSAWLVRDEKDDSTRSSRWLIDAPRPSPEPAGVSIAILARRRRRAVEAYCAELCPPALVDRAAGDALSAARAAAGGPPTDQQLLYATREVAGEHALSFMRAHANGSGLSGECESTPALLAARAGDRLSDGELERLECHLAGCLPCQATELRTTRAERMFATAITGADPIEAIAPPAATGSAAAPDEPAPLSPSRFLPAAAATATYEQPPAAARPETRRRRRPLWILGVLLAGCAAAATLLVALGSGKHATNAPASIRPAGRPTRSSEHHAAARSSKHHAATRHHRAHKAAKPARSKAHGSAATSVTTGSAGTRSVTSAAASAAPSTPTSNPAPAAQSSPQPAGGGSGAGSGGGSGGSGGGSVAVQQGGLPAQSAPTQGIGSGGSGH